MIKIRSANEADIEKISELEAACFNNPVSPTIIYEDICVAKHPYLLIELEGQVIGYGGMYVVIDEAYILNICILKEYRGNGYGKGLLKEMLITAAELGAISISLEVRVSNAVALELYKDMGFTIESVRKNYYEDTGEDAYIMWKNGLGE